MFERDIGGSRCRKRVDNTLRAQDLAPDGPRGHTRGEIHGRAEVAIVANKRGAMMQTPARTTGKSWRLATNLKSVDSESWLDRVRKYEKRAIAGD